MNKFLTYLMVTAFIMIGIPWIVVSFIKGDMGVKACMILFYAVCPLYSIIVGLYAGKNVKIRFILPLLTAAFFLGGIWMFFDFGDDKYKLFAAGYLMLGIIFMLFRAIFRKSRRGKTDE